MIKKILITNILGILFFTAIYPSKAFADFTNDTGICESGVITPTDPIIAPVNSISFLFVLNDQANIKDPNLAENRFAIQGDNGQWGLFNPDYVSEWKKPEKRNIGGKDKWVIQGSIRSSDASYNQLQVSQTTHKLLLFRYSSQDPSGVNVNDVPAKGLQHYSCSNSYYVLAQAPPPSKPIECTLQTNGDYRINAPIGAKTSVSNLPSTSDKFYKFILRVLDKNSNQPVIPDQEDPFHPGGGGLPSGPDWTKDYTIPGFETERVVKMVFLVKECDAYFKCKDTPVCSSPETTITIGTSGGSAIVPTIDIRQQINCKRCTDEHLPCSSTLCSACTSCVNVPATPIPTSGPLTLCQNVTGATQFKDACINCAKDKKLWTAIGCIPTKIEDVINQYLFTTGIGIVGGVAFLYLLYGCFLILTSAGNPEQIAQAREIITSSIMGLLLAIFSVFILRILTVNILQLPDFK